MYIARRNKDYAVVPVSKELWWMIPRLQVALKMLASKNKRSQRKFE